MVPQMGGPTLTRPDTRRARHTLSLIIPAFNEEARLPDLLAALDRSAVSAVKRAGMELTEILIVDDGSTDCSRAMLTEAGERDALVQPVFAYAENRGKGAAFAAGVERALGEYVLLADVDLSTPLDQLSKLTVAVCGGADIAIGSRAVAGAVVERGPLHRKVLGNSFNGAVRLLTGLRLRDTQNGFKLFPTPVAKRLVAEQTCPGFAFDVELLMRADQAGLRVAEVPIRYLHDSRSRLRVTSASMEMLRDVSSLAWRLRRSGRGSAAAAGRPGIVRRP
jgi:glycosyltransferase involved in cell wall biosynthesis